MKSCTLSSMAALMAAMSIITTQAAITLTITSPTPNKIVGDLLEVRASVSSTFEVVSVVAEVSSRQTNLTTVGPNAFSGVLSLSGFPRGSRSVLITANDAFGNAGSAQVSFVLDRPPSVVVVQPEPGLVVRRSVPIRAFCADDDSNCVLTVLVYLNNYGGPPFFARLATNSLEATVDFSGLDHSTAIVFISARDSAGQISTTPNTYALVEANPRLIEEARVPGWLWDFDSTRLLFLDRASSTIRIRDRTTNVDTIVASNNAASCSAFFPWEQWRCSPAGFLTPYGAILNVEKVNGHFGAGLNRSLGTISVFHLDSGDQIATITDANTLGDLAPSGAVTYTRSDGSVFLSTRPEPLGRGEFYPDPKTDGTNVIFLVSSNGMVNGQSTTFRWLMHFDGTTTRELTAPAPNAELSFQVNQGWLAFTKAGPSGISQVWRRPPGGVAMQLTFLGTGSSVRWLGSEGQLIYSHGPIDYLVHPDGTTVPLGSNGHWFGQDLSEDFIYSDGKLRRIIGGSLFELSTAPKFARLVETTQTIGAFQFTVIGDAGVTSVVQRSADLQTWQNLTTNVLSPLGFQVSETASNRFRAYRTTIP